MGHYSEYYEKEHEKDKTMLLKGLEKMGINSEGLKDYDVIMLRQLYDRRKQQLREDHIRKLDSILTANQK